MSNNPETVNAGSEKQKENLEALEQAGIEHRKKLREQREKESADHESSPEKIAKASHEALKEAASAEVEKQQVEQSRETSPAERRSGPPSTTRLDARFNATMDEVQTQMSAPSRTFSKVIHNKTVEKVSDTAAATIARPNAILSGAVFAFILTLGVYLVAKNLGYPLSGFETIGAFALGWIIGLLYDFLKVMITGRK